MFNIAEVNLIYRVHLSLPAEFLKHLYDGIIGNLTQYCIVLFLIECLI